MSGTADVGRLIVKIEATSAQLRQELERAKQQVAGFSGRAQQQVAKFETAWQGVGAGAVRAGVAFAAAAVSVQAITAAIGRMVTTADAAVAGAARLGVAVGNMDRGREIYDQLARGAQQAGISAADAAGAFGRLSIAARAIGATSGQTVQLVDTLQKLAVVSGTSGQEASSAIQQLGQALASGRLQGDELRSILESMPVLAEGLAKQLNVTVAQLRQMGTEGRLTSDVVFPAILRMSENVNAQLASMPVTVERATGMLSQAFANLVTQADRATGASQAIAAALQGAATLTQGLADRLAPASTLDRLRQVRAELEAIAQRQAEVAAGGRVPSGVQRRDAADAPALREQAALLEELSRREAVLAAQRQLGERAAAASAAAESARQQVLERVREVQESLGGTSAKTQQQMEALRTVVAAGDQAFARYGITAGQAAAMLGALQAKADAALGVIQQLNQQLQQGRADAIGGFAGRLNRELTAAAGNFGGDATQLDPVRVMQIANAVAQLAEQSGQAALQAARDETALARARAGGNAAAAARVRAEQNYQRNLEAGYAPATAAAIRTEELTQASLSAASASQTRLQPLAQVRQALQLEAEHARNLARQSTLGAQAQRVATEQDKARAEALKVARDGTQAYNAAYADFLRLIQGTSRDQAAADVNVRVRGLNDEIALIERETQLIGALPGVREAEIAALRVRQEMLASGKAYTEEEIARVQDLVRARERANAAQRQIEETLGRIRSTSEEISRDVATMMFEQMMDKGKGRSVEEWFKALFKRIAIQALSANIILPITTQIVGGMPGLFGISTGGASQAQIATALAAQQQASGGGGLLGLGASYQAGQTLLSSYPGFSGYGNGLVGGGVGGVFNPGYNFNTGLGFADSALNTPVFGVGGSSGYGSMSQAALIDAGQAGMTYGQLGMGALGIAGGAYGVYSGLQMGGAKGYTQAAGGAVGMAGGAAGLTVASGATAAGGALAGTAAGTAVAAVAAWAPYLAAAIFVASMLMSEKKPSNAAAGALIDLASGATQMMSSGKETAATGGARDQLVSLVQRATDQVSALVGGIRPNGTIGFELGQRDPSKMFLNGNLVGTAGVGDTEGLAKLFNQALLQAFASAPGLQDVEQRIFAASGQNLDFAVGLLTQTKQLVDTFGSDALNPDRNPATRAIYDAAIQTGSIENVVAALKGANELTQAYGDALNTADALKVVGAGGGNIQKIVSDLQWFFSVYQPLTDAQVQVSALDQAIAASNKTYADAITRATELGLATDKLAQKQVEAAEKIRQSLRDSYDAAMLEATGGGAVTQAVGAAKAIRANWNANALDYLAVGKDPNALYAAQMTAAFKDLDIATLERVVTELKGLDEVAVLFAQAALDAANATAETNKATARLATAKSFDAQLREATGGGWVNQIIDLADTIAANADAYRDAGKDPALLYAAQVKQIIDGLDADALATAAQYLQGLDGVAAEFVSAAIQTAQAAQQLASAAQIAADAADYDAKMRQALGLDLVNTIVAIRKEIDAMAARYTAAGRDPTALANAQINAALQGQDSATLAKTAAALQGIDTAAASMATSALEQTIAAEVQAAQAEIAAQAAKDAAQAQQDAARAQEQAAADAARAQEQAARDAAQAIQELARAGQNIKDYVAKLKSGTSAGFSPTDRLAAAQAQYNADLALAQGGNLDALGRITSDADALIAAAQAMYASGTQFQTIRDQIITQLNALPAVTTAEQQMVDKLGSIDTKLSTSNSSLSGISGNTGSTSSGVSAANALLASIDANNDGIISIGEIEATAKQRITEAQAALTTAAQQAATNTGATTTAVGATTTAVGGVKTEVGGTTTKIGEVKGEVTSSNEMIGEIKNLNSTLTNAATSSSGGFEALGTMLINLTKYASAAAWNTMYSRPASADPGIAISSARGNMFGDGSLITAPTAVPLSIMGEGGRPEAVVPLERDSRGRLGARIVGGAGYGAGNDNRPVVAAIERGHQLDAAGYQALRDEMRAMRAEIASLRNAQQRRNAS